MNLLQISDGYARMHTEINSPVESVVFNISKHMVKMGHNVTILERKNTITDPAIDYIDGVRVVRLATQRFSKERMSVFPHLVMDAIEFGLKVNKYLKKSDNFNVIHAHLPWASVVLVSLNRKIREKMFYTCHAGSEHRLRLSSNIKPPFYLRLFSPDLYVMKRVKKVIVLNQTLLWKLISSSKIKQENVEVIYNGVDVETFNPNIDASYVKNKYMLNEKITILFVGRISKRKGVEYLIRAANIIVNKLGYKSAMFLLVGRTGGGIFACKKHSPYSNYTSFLIKDLKLEGNVKITGYVPFDELRKLYAASDIFVLPSLEEGFALVATQAMACGKPVIGTRVGGIPIQIKDRFNGFIVDPANEKQLAEKIEYLIKNPNERREMGARSRKTAEQMFDWRRIAKKYLQVYTQNIT